MKHEFYYDEAGQCWQCMICGYVRGEVIYQKCPMNLEKSAMPEKRAPNKKCRKCGKACWGRLCNKCYATNKNRVTTWRNRRKKK